MGAVSADQGVLVFVARMFAELSQTDHSTPCRDMIPVLELLLAHFGAVH